MSQVIGNRPYPAKGQVWRHWKDKDGDKTYEIVAVCNNNFVVYSKAGYVPPFDGFLCRHADTGEVWSIWQGTKEGREDTIAQVTTFRVPAHEDLPWGRDLYNFLGDIDGMYRFTLFEP
jgi:hypothetical protein